MLTITMTAYRRPDYTAQVLESLSRCAGVEKWVFLPHVEPGDDRVITMIKQFHACESHPVFNETKLGLNKNSEVALRDAQMHRSQFNVHIEDDTLLSSDFLQYMEWASVTYKDDDKIFSVSAYNKLESPPPESEWFDVKRRDWFTCWGWGTWSKNLKKILDGWSTKNPKSFAWHINRVTRKRWFFKNRIEVHPVFSRVQNIGYRDGENDRTPQWYEENHKTGAFAGDVVVPEGPYQWQEK